MNHVSGLRAATGRTKTSISFNQGLYHLGRNAGDTGQGRGAGLKREMTDRARRPAGATIPPQTSGLPGPSLAGRLDSDGPWLTSLPTEPRARSRPSSLPRPTPSAAALTRPKVGAGAQRRRRGADTDEDRVSKFQHPAEDVCGVVHLGCPTLVQAHGKPPEGLA